MITVDGINRSLANYSRVKSLLCTVMITKCNANSVVFQLGLVKININEVKTVPGLH